ncbi:MAG TPA: hypothetical protein VGK19_25900 [Capsulimonadaceae bacterium]|jgi:multidrug transporter EmrE-like cation transporter
MIVGLLLCVVVGVLWASSGTIYSRVAKSGDSTLAFLACATGFSFFFSWLGVRDWHGVSVDATSRLPELVALMVVGGAFTGFYQQLMITAMVRGHNAVAWTIAQSAMAIPFLAGLAIWHDSPPASKIVGVCCLLATVAILGAAKTSRSELATASTWLPLVLTMFVANGVGQTLTTVPSRWPNWTDTHHLRVALSFTGVFAVNGLVAAFTKQRVTRATVLLGLLSSAFVFTAQMIIFPCMDILQRYGIVGICYPLACGSTIISFSLYSLLVLKERFQARETVAITLGLAGLGLMIIAGR